jgi:hypothetical protein
MGRGVHITFYFYLVQHHVAGDIQSPDALFQPSILKTFSSIWEVDFEIQDVGLSSLSSNKRSETLSLIELILCIVGLG